MTRKIRRASRLMKKILRLPRLVERPKSDATRNIAKWKRSAR